MKTSASPIKSAVEEIESLRKLFRAAAEAYCASLETSMDQLRDAIAAREISEKKPKIPAAIVRDARDIITLMRTLEIKPEKGRRRDLKKIEGVIEEMQKIVSKW